MRDPGIPRASGAPNRHYSRPREEPRIRLSERHSVRRWVDAVNAEGSYGVWEYAVVESVGEVQPTLQRFAPSHLETP